MYYSSNQEKPATEGSVTQAGGGVSPGARGDTTVYMFRGNARAPPAASAAKFHHLVDQQPYTGILRQEVLKRPGTLTSSKAWLVLDGETLMWWTTTPPNDKEFWKQDVPEKNRLLLIHLSVSAKSGADFEVCSADLGAKPMVLRCKDHSSAVAWVEAILAAKDAAISCLELNRDQWLSHLNSCVASGCVHEKYCRGFCRPHCECCHETLLHAPSRHDSKRDCLLLRPYTFLFNFATQQSDYSLAKSLRSRLLDEKSLAKKMAS